jgi:hypothetical protein
MFYLFFNYLWKEPDFWFFPMLVEPETSFPENRYNEPFWALFDRFCVIFES